MSKRKIVYFFAFKEGNEGKQPSMYPELYMDDEQVESTRRFLEFHGGIVSHVENREPTQEEIEEHNKRCDVRTSLQRIQTRGNYE